MVASNTISYAAKLIGSYILDEKIGEGAFGKVYKARHRYLEKYACIKTIRAEQSRSNLDDLILHEASVLNKLKHKNIIRLEDLYIEGDQINIIMDYADGGDLSRLLKEAGGPLPVEQVENIIQQIAEGLHYAHQKQILHRDLKPQNILRYQDGTIVIADFGIAKILDSTGSPLTQMGMANLGTLGYMAPEHCEGRPIFASDLYSLGVIAYRLLTYRLPFTGSDKEVRYGHCHKAPPSLRSFNEQLTPEIDEVVLKMLEKDPQQRYATPLEFARALRTAITKMTLQIQNVNPENIREILPTLQDDQAICLDPGDYEGPLLIQKRIRMIGAGSSTRIYTIDEPVLHICASGVQLERMLIQRTREDTKEPVIQADEDISYELRNVSIQGGLPERAFWKDSAWQLPVEGIDFGDIPIESVQEREVAIEVKNWCTVETSLQGLDVFPRQLSPGPHTLLLTFRAKGKLPGTRLTGRIKLRSEGEDEPKEIHITGQIQSQLSAPSLLPSESSALAPQHWPYQLRDEAARSLLRELGSDEEKSLVSQLQWDRRTAKLKQTIMKHASDRLFDLIGQRAVLWYIRRLKVDAEASGDEEWIFTLAVDAGSVDDMPDALKALLKQRKTLRLRSVLNREGRRKLFICSLHFPGIEEGGKDLSSLPALIQLTPFVSEHTYTEISAEFLAQIEELPIQSRHEVDRDQLKIWEMWLQIQGEQINRKQYQAKYTSHTYREGAATITFTLDKEDVRNYKGDIISYQEFQDLARKTRREGLKLLPSLPEKGKPQKKRGQDIGTQEQFQPEKGTLTLRLDAAIAERLKNGSYDLPASGYLCFDASGDAVQIERQRFAMDDLKQGRTVNRRLPDFFFDATKARLPKETHRLQPADLLSGTTNSGQIAAIEAALNVPDLLFIQGPPGTGKTTVIAEICYQVARKGGRTLVASQSNLAVDNALGRIIRHPSIRALRKGNLDSIEEEGRDFIEERVVEKWLSNTAQDCQAKLEKRRRTIAQLKALTASSRRFSLYCEQETAWSKQKLGLQRKLDTIKGELEEINAALTQKEQDERHSACIFHAVSTVLTGTLDEKRTEGQEALQIAFQHLTKTINMQVFVKRVTKGLHIVKRVDLAPPATFSLLECCVWLKKQAHIHNEQWKQGRRTLEQAQNALRARNTIQVQQREVLESLRATKEQLHSLQTTLHQQASERRQLERAWKAIPENSKSIITGKLTKWILDEIQNQRPLGNPPKDLEPGNLLSAEILAVIQTDQASMFFNDWLVMQEDVKQYVQKIVRTIQKCNQLHERLPSLYQSMSQELSAVPEMNQMLGQAQPVQHAIPATSDAFDELVKGIEQRLRTLSEMRLQPSNLTRLLFKEKEKQDLYHLFCEIRDLLLTASKSRDAIFKSIRNNIEGAAEKVAQELTTSLMKWYTTRKESLDSMADPLAKERLEKEQQRLQRLYREEETQCSSITTELYKTEEEVINRFRDVSQCEAIPGELREVARRNVELRATSSEHIEQYQTLSKSWIADLQRLESLVSAIWTELGSVTKKAQQELQQTRETLSNLQQQQDKLKSEQDKRLNRLLHPPSKLTEERSWWKAFWEDIPEHLRPQTPSDGIFSSPFLQQLQQQFETWERELVEEERFAQRYDGLITDWVAALQNLSESDKQGLRDEYIKQANVIGITCNQAYKLNWKEMRQFSTFDVVIIDEVSKATPPEILLPALKGKKLILIGDRHQLPPMMDDKTFEQALDESGQDPTAFECLNRPYFAEHYNQAPEEIKRMLHIQYRMHPDIMAAINQFYERPLECGLLRPDLQRDHQFESRMIGKNKHIVWLNTPLVSARERNGRTQRISARNTRSGFEVLNYQSAFPSFGEESSGTSVANRREAEIITKICQELDTLWMPKRAAGAEQKEIGIITFYAAQEKLLRDMLKISRTGASADFKALDFRIGTVDRFQGMERAIIIVSMVRNNAYGDIGFAKKDERINVALSRSQQLLIIVGCHDLFCVTANREQAIERYKNVARIVRNRGEFIDVSCL